MFPTQVGKELTIEFLKKVENGNSRSCLKDVGEERTSNQTHKSKLEQAGESMENTF